MDELVSNFESPVVIAVQDEDLLQARHSLIIRSNVSSVDPVTQEEQDEGLDRTSFHLLEPKVMLELVRTQLNLLSSDLILEEMVRIYVPDTYCCWYCF